MKRGGESGYLVNHTPGRVGGRGARGSVPSLIRLTANTWRVRSQGLGAMGVRAREEKAKEGSMGRRGGWIRGVGGCVGAWMGVGMGGGREVAK